MSREPSTDRVYCCLQRCKGGKENIVGILPPRYAPYLFNWIQIRRVWRKLDKDYGLPDVFVFWKLLSLYKTHRLLVPWSVVHYHRISFPFRNRMRCQKGADRVNRGRVIECLRLCCKQLTSFRDDKAAV